MWIPSSARTEGREKAIASPGDLHQMKPLITVRRDVGKDRAREVRRDALMAMRLGAGRGRASTSEVDGVAQKVHMVKGGSERRKLPSKGAVTLLPRTEL